MLTEKQSLDKTNLSFRYNILSNRNYLHCYQNLKTSDSWINTYSNFSQGFTTEALSIYFLNLTPVFWTNTHKKFHKDFLLTNNFLNYQPTSHFLFHKNVSLRDIYVMTLLKTIIFRPQSFAEKIRYLSLKIDTLC